VHVVVVAVAVDAAAHDGDHPGGRLLRAQYWTF